MLFLSNHGGHAKDRPAGAYRGDGHTSLQSACGYTASEYYPTDLENHLGPFGYFLLGAPVAPHDHDTTARLDALADATIDQPPLAEGNGPMSAVFTYWGQFIDHDITAGSDRDTGPSVIDSPIVSPADRAAVS